MRVAPTTESWWEHMNNIEELERHYHRLYSEFQAGKLDEATRAGLREYQKAEGLKVTGTLNKLTLEKMSIELTDKQKAM